MFEERPSDFADLAGQPHKFVVFFPLGATVNRKIVEIVSNQPVPAEAREFPTFRDGVVDPATGRVANWWLWDGQREWMVGQITYEQRHFPILAVVNDTQLIEWILSDWTPFKDPA